jgi:hypothetical protein
MAGKFRRRNYDPIPVRNPSALKRAATDEQNCHKYRTDPARRTDPVTRQLPNGMISNFGFLRLDHRVSKCRKRIVARIFQRRPDAATSRSLGTRSDWRAFSALSGIRGARLICSSSFEGAETEPPPGPLTLNPKQKQLSNFQVLPIQHACWPGTS